MLLKQMHSIEVTQLDTLSSQRMLAIEEKLTEALESKMAMLDEKLTILQQNRESEERIVHTLATMRDFQVLNLKFNS